MGGTGPLKFRMVVPALPCEEGIDEDNKDPRMPGVMQALQDLNRMIVDLQKQLAIFTSNTANASTAAADYTLKGTNPILVNGGAEAKISTNPTISFDAAYVADFSTLNFLYGSGYDGALSLSSNTTMTVDQVLRQYSSIVLNGYTLTGHSSNGFMLLMCSGTLAMGGGTIQGAFTSSAAAGGSAPPSSTAGPGGNGGRARYPVFVFAKKITGPGTITAAGEDGASGGASGLTSDTNVHAGGNGQNGQTAIARWSTTTINGITATGGIQRPSGISGGSASGSVLTDKINMQLRDFFRMLFFGDTNFTSVDARCWCGTDGSAGAGCYVSASGAAGFASGDYPDGGGAGAGGHGLMGPGGSGGGGGDATGNDGNAKGSGAGGGGGAGGGLAIVMTDNCEASITVTSDGGDGGSGSGASTPAVAGGGGGGGPGGPGAAYLIAQAGCTATVSAAAGSFGSGGAGAPGGSPGTAASVSFGIQARLKK